jgi:signal transduction histidine kinase
MPEGGRIIVRLYDKIFEKPGDGVGRRTEDTFKIGERAVIVEIEDSGVGIPEEYFKKVFDPFFTTKGPRQGSGLGLSVSRNIIETHKGLIDITSRVNRGTKVTVTLKIAGG